MDMGGDRQRAVRDGGAVGPGRPGDGPRLAVLRDAPPDGRAVCLAGAPDQTPGRARPGLRLVQAAHLGRRAHPRGVLERRAAAVTIPVILGIMFKRYWLFTWVTAPGTNGNRLTDDGARDHGVAGIVVSAWRNILLGRS